GRDAGVARRGAAVDRRWHAGAAHRDRRDRHGAGVRGVLWHERRDSARRRERALDRQPELQGTNGQRDGADLSRVAGGVRGGRDHRRDHRSADDRHVTPLLEGRARRFGDDVNTDYIISSARKKETLDESLLKKYLLETVDPSFAATV